MTATAGRGSVRIRATAAGRVNLIGDHVDYMGGPVLPMAIDLCTTVEAVAAPGAVALESDSEPDAARFDLPVDTRSDRQPGWARYVSAVAEVLEARTGLSGRLRSTLPAGVGLSSSAALEVAVALALSAADGGTLPEGVEAELGLARACQEAEHRAVGVPTGIMDQLAIVSGRAGRASLIDCSSLEVDPVPLPGEVEVWVVHSGERRSLEGSAYAQRREAAERAEAIVGHLPTADRCDIEAIPDPALRRRARHVGSESQRVRDFARALREGDPRSAGVLMSDSHRSLRDDFEVSTPRLDELVDRLQSTPGVLGARLTGAGFGGCAVALAEPGLDLSGRFGESPLCRVVAPSQGISLEVSRPD